MKYHVTPYGLIPYGSSSIVYEDIPNLIKAIVRNVPKTIGQTLSDIKADAEASQLEDHLHGLFQAAVHGTPDRKKQAIQSLIEYGIEIVDEEQG